jgi:hypothetical protein
VVSGGLRSGHCISYMSCMGLGELCTSIFFSDFYNRYKNRIKIVIFVKTNFLHDKNITFYFQPPGMLYTT